MTAEEDALPASGFLGEEQARALFADMNEVIRAGEETRRLRSEMITVFAALGWSQERIARLTGLSQPAVSKQVAKARPDRSAPQPPPDVALDQRDGPWLEGRLWGLAEDISASLHGDAHCTRLADAFGRGRKLFTPSAVDALRRLVERDLAEHRTKLSPSHRSAYDVISRGLDVPETTTVADGSASVRRALARRIQRDRLGGGN
ncbi:sigma-70 family RNA polymerase sigma factor [Streptomyces californicus]|uniref:sigma-70 family RNA polymerase sigma factor n=1 Tax=Streptomyces californicus TaxID=67351 RepID=UPI0037AD443F